MKSQIFKYEIDKQYIISIIKNNFLYNTLLKSYDCDKYIFKKLLMNNIINQFYSYIEPKYYDSKKNYPLNMTTYKGFLTLLRQLCKHLDIAFTYDIKYIHSTYIIIYHIHLDEEQVN